MQFVKEIKPLTIVNNNFEEKNCIKSKIGPEVEDGKYVNIGFLFGSKESKNIYDGELI